MERTNLKASIVIAIIGIILISVIYFRPVSINREYSGYMYNENIELGKTVEINLDGVLRKNLSLNYEFTGSIKVDGIKKQVILKRIWAKNNVFKTLEYSAFIETKNIKTGQYEIDGTVNTSKNFNEILIKLDEVDSKYNSKFNICGPSSTREEAKGIITKMEKNN
ncbi:hypothetical protein KPL37_03210 [Clostridium frigoris]|uniref:Uncharacterized protein n=1 Tax=Clostridium frigoris TaxID=205327 RepID=A0ABS6BPE6_9CLOT|nr:hypothetical protein [Clostridium frigoris]MBU3158783.1 hypothetical protein [Clostridium frigoris]